MRDRTFVVTRPLNVEPRTVVVTGTHIAVDEGCLKVINFATLTQSFAPGRWLEVTELEVPEQSEQDFREMTP